MSSNNRALLVLACIPLTLSSQMKDTQVEISHGIGSSKDSDVEIFRIFMSSGVTSGCQLLIQLRRGIETWSLRVQVSRWAAVSVTPGQQSHSVDCILPILESFSLVGNILEWNVFCSGESPNILDMWYEEESSTPGCLSSSLELSRIVKIFIC